MLNNLRQENVSARPVWETARFSILLPQKKKRKKERKKREKKEEGGRKIKF
jgi:hypothetical protein